MNMFTKLTNVNLYTETLRTTVSKYSLALPGLHSFSLPWQELSG